MKNNAKFVSKFGLAILVLTMCSGCKPLFDLFQKKSEPEVKKVEKEEIKKEDFVSPAKEVATGEVLLKIDGKSVLRESDFNKHLAQMLQMNPYFRGASPDALPAPLKRKFFDELIKQELILAWADKNNVDSDPEFVKSFEEMKNLVKRSLLVQRFESKIFDGIKVSDSEVKDHFEKDKSKFIKEPGGVNVSGIKFNDKEKADVFYDKVKGKTAAFAELAKKESRTDYKDFGRITKEDQQQGLPGNDIPSQLKDKALSLSKVPAVEKINVGKNTWVMLVSDKKDPQYFDLAEIKPQLEAMLKNNKFRDVLDDKVKNLEKDFTIVRNYEFFQESEANSPVDADDVKRADKKVERIPASAV